MLVGVIPSFMNNYILSTCLSYFFIILKFLGVVVIANFGLWTSIQSVD